MGGSFSALLAGGGALADALEKQDDEALQQVLVKPLPARARPMWGSIFTADLPIAIAVLYWCTSRQRGCFLQLCVNLRLVWTQCLCVLRSTLPARYRSLSNRTGLLLRSVTGHASCIRLAWNRLKSDGSS